MQSTNSILLVEDDADLRALLCQELRTFQHQVDEADNGTDGLEKALAGNYDLIILDLNLPKMDGLEVCRLIRNKNEEISILMLTARKEELDRVLGLELGADDYLTKPFSMRELLARVKAILRRVSLRKQKSSAVAVNGGQTCLDFGELLINLGMRTVSLSGTVLPISSMEFDLLSFLAENPGKAFTREELLEKVWGYAAVGYEHNVTTHMNRIRRKLETDLENPKYLKTVRGFGYAFAQPNDFQK